MISLEASAVQSGVPDGHLYNVWALTTEKKLSKVARTRYLIRKLILKNTEISIFRHLNFWVSFEYSPKFMIEFLLVLSSSSDYPANISKC